MNLIELLTVISAFVGFVSFSWLIYEHYYPIKKITWRKAQKEAKKIANEIISDNYFPTLIFGIGRGGSIFGSMISGCLGHCPLVVIDRQYEWSDLGRSDDLIFNINIPYTYLEKVLLVAGEAHSGGTMKRYYDFLLSLDTKEIRRVVLFLEKGCVFKMEYYGILSSKKTIKMPWMFTKSYARQDRIPPKVTTITDNVIKLHLLRHAESEAGEEIFAGKTDFKISANGLKEAISFGQKISSENIKAIYTSPLLRAYETALIIKGFLPCADLNINENLKEMDFGIWDGETRANIRKKMAIQYNKWNVDPLRYQPRQSESPESVQSRMLSFFDYMRKTYHNRNKIEILAISHKTAIRTILCHFCDKPLSEYRSYKIDHLQIFSFYLSKDGWAFIN